MSLKARCAGEFFDKLKGLLKQSLFIMKLSIIRIGFKSINRVKNTHKTGQPLLKVWQSDKVIMNDDEEQSAPTKSRETAINSCFCVF